jgi:hypothetical protein
MRRDRVAALRVRVARVGVMRARMPARVGAREAQPPSVAGRVMGGLRVGSGASGPCRRA